METDTKKSIIYPYLPKGNDILYVSEDNEFIKIAKQFAKDNSLDKVMPNSSVIVKDNKIIGIGANGSDYHEKHGCYRKEHNLPTGEGYELCEGCSPKNHGEAQAIKDALSKGNNPNGADLYLWGHWWCCKPCWDAMINSGIKNIYLLDKSEILFNKDNPDNIIGYQFE